MSPPTKSRDEKLQKLSTIIASMRTAFLVTHSADGGLHGRPMAAAEAEADLTRLWFATSTQSAKVQELLADDRILCACSNATGSEWATVNGRARLVNDRSRINELWSPFWKNWFSGPDDPNLALLEVTPESAEYWDSGSAVLTMVKLAMAAVTGKKFDEGENERVAL